MKKLYFLKNGGKPVNMGDVIQITKPIMSPFGEVEAKFDVKVTPKSLITLEREGFVYSKMVEDKKPREAKDPIVESVNLLKSMGLLPKDAAVVIVTPTDNDEVKDKMQEALHKIFSMINGEKPSK